jgi:hypothetical protein
MAISGSFSPGAGVSTVFGDNAKNTITTSRDAAGTLLVNRGAVPIVGGTATVANTAQIHGFGLGADDTISLDEIEPALSADALIVSLSPRPLTTTHRIRNDDSHLKLAKHSPVPLSAGVR